MKKFSRGGGDTVIFSARKLGEIINVDLCIPIFESRPNDISLSFSTSDMYGKAIRDK